MRFISNVLMVICLNTSLLNGIFSDYSRLGEPFFIAQVDVNQALQLYNIPIIGRYCDTYPTGWHLMLIEKKLNGDALQAMPELLRARISQVTSESVDFYIQMIDTRNIRMNMTAPIVNLITHAWKFPYVKQGESLHAEIDIGIFTEEHGGIEAGGDQPAAINRLSKQSVNPHPADHERMCCSPNNAQFKFNPTLGINTCWSLVQDGQRTAISYHVFINDSALSQQLAEQLSQSENTYEALINLRNINEWICQPVAEKIEQIL